MAKAEPQYRNPVAPILRDAKFRSNAVRNRKGMGSYKRKDKHPKRSYD